MQSRIISWIWQENRFPYGALAITALLSLLVLAACCSTPDPDSDPEPLRYETMQEEACVDAETIGFSDLDGTPCVGMFYVTTRGLTPDARAFGSQYPKDRVLDSQNISALGIGQVRIEVDYITEFTAPGPKVFCSDEIQLVEEQAATGVDRRCVKVSERLRRELEADAKLPARQRRYEISDGPTFIGKYDTVADGPDDTAPYREMWCADPSGGPSRVRRECALDPDRIYFNAQSNLNVVPKYLNRIVGGDPDTTSDDLKMLADAVSEEFEKNNNTNRTVTIYVHGYNQDFIQGSSTLAHLVSDFQIDRTDVENVVGVPILLSWPALDTWPLEATSADSFNYNALTYLESQLRADHDSRALPVTIDALLSYTDVQRINIVAHSMGNRFIHNNLAYLVASKNNKVGDDVSVSVLMIAADVAYKPFREKLKANSGNRSGLPLSLSIYFNEEDGALLASGKLVNVPCKVDRNLLFRGLTATASCPNGNFRERLLLEPSEFEENARTKENKRQYQNWRDNTGYDQDRDRRYEHVAMPRIRHLYRSRPAGLPNWLDDDDCRLGRGCFGRPLGRGFKDWSRTPNDPSANPQIQVIDAQDFVSDKVKGMVPWEAFLSNNHGYFSTHPMVISDVGCALEPVEAWRGKRSLKPMPENAAINPMTRRPMTRRWQLVDRESSSQPRLVSEKCDASQRAYISEKRPSLMFSVYFDVGMAKPAYMAPIDNDDKLREPVSALPPEVEVGEMVDAVFAENDIEVITIHAYADTSDYEGRNQKLTGERATHVRNAVLKNLPDNLENQPEVITIPCGERPPGSSSNERNKFNRVAEITFYRPGEAPKNVGEISSCF